MTNSRSLRVQINIDNDRQAAFLTSCFLSTPPVCLGLPGRRAGQRGCLQERQVGSLAHLCRLRLLLLRWGEWLLDARTTFCQNNKDHERRGRRRNIENYSKQTLPRKTWPRSISEDVDSPRVEYWDTGQRHSAALSESGRRVNRGYLFLRPCQRELVRL